MAKESKRRCPDCEIDISGLSLSSKGDGRCIECKGTGRDRHSEALVQAATLGLEGDYYPCKICAGTGQCQTCGGTGYEYYYDDDISYHSENSSSAGSGSSDFLAKVIGFLIVAAIVIWVVFAVAIPLVIINIAIISLIVGLAQKKFKIILFPVSILGAIYIVVDYNKGLFTKTLVNNVSFFSGLIPIFFYANIIAGLIAAYFLIRDLINKKNPPVENQGEFSKRNLIIMGSLLLVGCITIVLQNYYASNDSQQFQSSVSENSSEFSTETKVMNMIFKGYEEGDNIYLIFNDIETGEEYSFQNPDLSKFNGIKILIEDKNAEFDVRANPKYVNKKFIVEALYKTVLASGPEGETVNIKTWVITNLKEANRTEQVNASHILFILSAKDSNETINTAKVVFELAKKGENFASLAKKYSMDKNTFEKGGDLGWFGRGIMVPEFEEAVFNADVGEVVGLIRTAYGIHIAKVNLKEMR